MAAQDIETFYPKSVKDWRMWLEKNHANKESIWVIFYKKETGYPTITWSESVDQALCFGWIDSLKRKLDEQRSIQFFSKRKPKSTWSRVNKEKVEKLIGEGLMTKAGFRCIEIAKENGTWTMLDEVENLITPEDLQVKLDQTPLALAYFTSLTKTPKKQLLQWLVLARTEDTRNNRIQNIVENASLGQLPMSFRIKNNL